MEETLLRLLTHGTPGPSPNMGASVVPAKRRFRKLRSYNHREPPLAGYASGGLERPPSRFDLTIPCSLCGYKILPTEILRVGWSLIRCPSCGQNFDSMRDRKLRSTS
jgi:DNA-directed RNA polymerase subunit RPC12/RpoP